MKCLIFEQMMAYLDGEVPLQERQQMDSHLAACSACRTALESCMSDFAAFDALSDALPLPDSFTNEIMAAISSKAAENKTEPKLKTIDLILNTCWRGSMKKKMVVTAAGLAIAISIGAYTSPTFASYVQSLLNLQAETKDQDIVFKVTNAAITPDQISVQYEFLKNGVRLSYEDTAKPFRFNMDEKQLDFYGYGNEEDESRKNDVYVTDEQGNKLIDRSLIHATGYKNDSSLISIHLIPEMFEKLPEKIVLHVEVNKVAGKEGKWHLTAPINVKELKEKSGFVITDKNFTFPNGTILNLKGWQSINSVSSIAAVFVDSKHGWANEYGPTQFGFQVTNKQGEAVAVYDPAGLQDVNYVGNVAGSDSMAGLGYQFKRFKEDDDYTFELTSFHSYDKLGLDLNLDPQAIAKKPLVKDLGGGKTLKITKVELKTDDGLKEVPVRQVNGLPVDQEIAPVGDKGIFIEVEGRLDKETVNLTNWKVKVDNQEKEWVVWDPTRLKQDENGNYKFRKVIIIRDVEKMPKNITLESVALNKKAAIDWKVPLGKPKPE
ncbi:hypothetical protein QJ48_03260 [Paenibacillus sp. A3]|uniref:zf-HC2 domain-containing protein n=1 Tax=Paenibacillus sp. A3 TaxID=1337054 RepID=UPI0006D58115|nr:zf-HC2 domain-containing protein [Paenibacillus sp. A3]KPV60847.1 hypothetical protein QJ48_03260 [Paenibacillus sp. A3]